MYGRAPGSVAILVILISMLPALHAAPVAPLQEPPRGLQDIGGWRTTFNASLLEDYGVTVLDAGFTEAERLAGALYMGGYATALLVYGGQYYWYTDAVVFPYSFAEGYNKFTEEFLWLGFDAFSDYYITYDTVTDLLAVDTVNVTGSASLYVAAAGLDYASYLEDYPVFYGGVFMYPVDYDGLFQGSGVSDTYNVSRIQELFGDANIVGVAFTSLAYAWSPSPALYAAGFICYNESGDIYEYPFLFRYDNPFNVSQGPGSAMIYRLPYYYPRAWRPYRVLVENNTVYMIGILYAKTGGLSLYYPEGLFVLSVNASTLSYIDSALLPVRSDLSLGATGPALFTRPYTRYWGTPTSLYDFGSEGGFGEGYSLPAYMDDIGVAVLGDKLLIAGYGYENDTLDYIGIAYLIDTGGWSPSPSSWSIERFITIGSATGNTSVDFAAAAELFVDDAGNSYAVIGGALNLSVDENLSRLNSFYLVLGLDTGETLYAYLVGGNSTDMVYDIGEIDESIPEGVVVRPYYSAMVSDSPSIYVSNITDLYVSGAIAPLLETRPHSYRGPVDLIGGGVERHPPAPGVVLDKKRLAMGLEKSVEAHQSPYGGVWAYLLQPGLPPSTDMTVYYEPAGPVMWSSTPGYVLVNITAVLIDNVTGEPLAGAPVKLFVSPPGSGSYTLYATGYTGSDGVVAFQYNATVPGAYFFEIIYLGTALHGRAFQVIRIDLPNYRSLLSLSIEPPVTYTLYEDEPMLYANLSFLNLSGAGNLFTLGGQLVFLELYIDDYIASRTGLAEDTWYTVAASYTNSSGIAVFSLPRGLFYYYYAHNYTFRVHYYGNDTVATPENTSLPAVLDIEPTPTRLVLVEPPIISGDRNVTDTEEITVMLVWSHDGFATVYPVAGAEVDFYYLPENQTGVIYVADTNATGYALVNITYTAAANTSINIVFYGNETFLGDTLGPYNVSVYPLRTLLQVVEEPATAIYSLEQTRLSVRVVRADNYEPVENAVIYAYANNTYLGYALTDADGSFTLEIPYHVTGLNVSETLIDAARIPAPGPLNITLVFNGTLGEIVGTGFGPIVLFREGALNVVEGEVTTRVIDVLPTPVAVRIIGGSANVSGSTIYIHATEPATLQVAVVYGPHYIYNVDIQVYLNDTLVASEPVAPHGTVAYATVTITAPSAAYYELRASFPGAPGLQQYTMLADMYARWDTMVLLNRSGVRVLASGYENVIVYLEATAFYFNYTSGAWRPLANATVDFYYNASIHYIASNTTGADGNTWIIAEVPRGIKGFTVTIPSTATTDPSSDTAALEELSLPRDTYYLLATPAPEPPILPLLLLAAIIATAAAAHKRRR